MITDFDIAQHADKATKSFSAVRPKYALLAEQVRRIIEQSFADSKIVSIHKIEHRAKDVESFRKKCGKTSTEKSPKYISPLEQITDLSGVRVILFFPDDIKKMCEFIEAHFDCGEIQNIGEERFARSGNLGYQSIHYLVKIHPDRLKFPDFAQFDAMICEIQVRTILQHAWAEMEHDIQYKSSQSLPTEIKRKFAALAGMLEIADREFQSIQSEDSRLRDSIKKSLEEQLTKEGLAAKETVVQKPDLGTAQTDAPGALNARALVITGNYKQAIEVYSQQIASIPSSYTHYLGRAKAKFLAGDRSGALADIDFAKSCKADDPAIKLIEAQIATGNMTKPLADSDHAYVLLKAANESLSLGRGEEAFVDFSSAQDCGYNYIFSIFNKSMACVLVKDTPGAIHLLGELRPSHGTPMYLNFTALVCIVSCIDGEEDTQMIEHLKEIRSNMNNFSYKMSPLRNLEAGMIARDGMVPSNIGKIFDILKSTPNDKAE